MKRLFLGRQGGARADEVVFDDQRLKQGEKPLVLIFDAKNGAM